MTKLRQPNSFEDAIVQVIAILGREEAATAAGKGTTRIADWSDPDRKDLPDAAQIVAMDAACKALTGATPITSTMTRMLEAVDFDGAHVDVLDALLSMHVSMCRTTEAVRAAKAPTSPNGKRLSACERQKIQTHLARHRRQLDELERAIGADEPAGKVTPIRTKGAA